MNDKVVRWSEIFEQHLERGQHLVIALKSNQHVSDASNAHFVATVLNVPSSRVLGEIRKGYGVYVESEDGLSGLRGAADPAQNKNGGRASEVREQMSRNYGLASLTKKLLFKSDLVNLIQRGHTPYSVGEAGATGITQSTLKAAFKRRMPGLSGALDAMLARGEKGEKGGAVLIDSADPAEIARVFAEKTGRSIGEAQEDIQASIRIFHDGVRRVGDFIVPETPEFAGNTSGDLAYLNDKPIRLAVGEHFQSHRGYGVVKLAGEADRASARREPPAYTGDRAENFARHVVAVANSADALFEEGGRMILRASRLREALVLDDRGTHWSVISLRPAERDVWGRPVRTGRGLVQSLSRRPASAPYQSPGGDISPTPDRKSLGVQTEHFDLTNPTPGWQEKSPARNVKVTHKRRRKIDPRFSRNGDMQGFFDKQSGLTFLIAPNLTDQTAVGVLLHEVVHGQQNADLDRRATEMLETRNKGKTPELRANQSACPY